MSDTITISLPDDLRRSIARSAKKQKLTRSEYVRRVLRQQLWEESFDELCRALEPKARAMGIYTDEDVFKIVS